MAKQSQLASLKVTPKDGGFVEIVFATTEDAQHVFLVPQSAARALAALLIQSLTVVDPQPLNS